MRYATLLVTATLFFMPVTLAEEESCLVRPGDPIPASFARSKGDDSYTATTSIRVGMSADAVVRRLQNIEAYAQWAFLAADGAETLESLQFDETTGVGSLNFRGGDADSRLEGTFERLPNGARLKLTNSDRFGDVVLEGRATPVRDCSKESRLTMELTWSLGRVARWVAGESAWAPSFVLLKIRDDFLVSTMDPAEWYPALLADDWEFDGERWHRELDHPRDGRVTAFCTRVVPSGVTVDSNWVELHQSQINRARKSKKWKATITTAFALLEGEHSLTSFVAYYDNNRGWSSAGERGDLGYSLQFDVVGDEIHASMGLWFPEN